MPKKSKKTSRPTKIRYAVVGLGHIAQIAVLPAFKNAKKNSELVALVSGDPVKLKKLGKKYQVKHTVAYEDFERLLDLGEIDAVYIATPNTLHLPLVEKAAAAGVHVLCEKPLASTQEDAYGVVKTAEENKILVMTAYRLHFNAANIECIQTAKSGKLGDLKIFNSIFTMQVSDKKNIRLKEEMGGGPLYDIGIYCINAARYLFGAEPTEVMAFAESKNGDTRFREVDEMVSVTLRFPDHRLASFTVSFGASSSADFDLIGTKARLRLENAYEYSSPMVLTTIREGKKTIKRFAKEDQFAPELLYFSDCILKSRQPEPSAKEGLIDVEIIEAIHASIASKKPIMLHVSKKKRRPTGFQVISKPGITPPKGVHVQSPH